MDTVLTDFSDSALTDANLANLYASTTFSYNLPGSEVHKGDDICWCITDIPVRPPNVVFNARLDEDNADRVIDGIVEKAREKKVSIRWYTDRNTRPANLGEYLLNRGFTAYNPVPLMAVSLDILKEEPTKPDGLEVIEVQDMDTLRTWENTCARGFGGNPDGPTPIFKWFTFILEYSLPIRFFLAFQNGVPVATAQMTLAEGVAGIDRVATVPEARRQGIAYAVTLHPLLTAREAGYRIGTLQATDAGARVYNRMGFRACGEMRLYHWNYVE
ncbi:MAG: GNAT family N-acetyltransferase [Dehalococcoidales bacterium]|nr:GNAT family N-acetyltransferase [Dehalococcoidales bacterium]